MSVYSSCFSSLIENFVEYRKASGSWNEPCYGLNIRLFDHYCARHYPDSRFLSQEMIDAWCAKRDTETNRSCETRRNVTRAFLHYLRERGLVDAVPPEKLRAEPRSYVPHAFSGDELERFFQECDSIRPYLGRRQSVIRKITIPVFFRLLYSTGMGTTEARLLRRDDVGLGNGIINIRKSKGYDQHYVVMHDTMAAAMARYDEAADRLQPDRTYFFQSDKGGWHSRYWVQDNFRSLWEKANGTKDVSAYALRHHYAVTNIDSWTDDGFGFCDRLQHLSKSMGHRSVEATRYYYSIVPRLSDTLAEKTEKGFNAIIPEVPDEA